jgi:hypothetical protein
VTRSDSTADGRSATTRRRRAGVASLGALTVLAAAAVLPRAVDARREAAPAGSVALCGIGETCRNTGCHFSFPFGSDTLSWELRQGVPDAPLPAWWVPGRALQLRLVATDASAWYLGFQLGAVRACPAPVNGGRLELLEPARTTTVTDGFGIDYLTHSCTCLDLFDCCGFVPEVLGSGSFEWTFLWTPPERGAGPVTFQLAFNTANGDGTPDFDVISLGELVLDEEPCPPPVDDLRVRKAACDPAAPGQQRAEPWRAGGGGVEILREAGDASVLALPRTDWALVAEGCRPLADGRSLVAWSVAPSCALGGEGPH